MDAVNKSWLDTLKVDDYVGIIRGQSAWRGQVTRTKGLKASIEVDGIKYRRSNSYRCGRIDSWSSTPYLVQRTSPVYLSMIRERTVKASQAKAVNLIEKCGDLELLKKVLSVLS